MNILAGVSLETLFRDVTDFAREYDLSHEISSLKKGAVLAQGACAIRDIPDITRVEIEVLELETESKWRQPWSLWFTVVVCSLGAVVQGMFDRICWELVMGCVWVGMTDFWVGWCQTGANGANLRMPKEFGIDSDRLVQHITILDCHSDHALVVSQHDTLVLGLINAAPCELCYPVRLPSYRRLT